MLDGDLSKRILDCDEGEAAVQEEAEAREEEGRRARILELIDRSRPREREEADACIREGASVEAARKRVLAVRAAAGPEPPPRLEEVSDRQLLGGLTGLD